MYFGNNGVFWPWWLWVIVFFIVALFVFVWWIGVIVVLALAAIYVIIATSIRYFIARYEERHPDD